jgi:hypothetical protein
MPEETVNRRAEPYEEPRQRGFWYDFLTMFPFVFLPLAALSGVALSLIMPILTGAYRR